MHGGMTAIPPRALRAFEWTEQLEAGEAALYEFGYLYFVRLKPARGRRSAWAVFIDRHFNWWPLPGRERWAFWRAADEIRVPVATDGAIIIGPVGVPYPKAPKSR